MQVIRLSAGQTYEIPGSTFTGQLRVGLSGGAGFEVNAPRMESRRRGDRVALRNPTAPTEVTVLPGDDDAHFPTGTTLFVTLHLEPGAGDVGEGVQLEFPSFEIGGLRSFPVATVLPEGDRVRIVAAEATSDSLLDEGSAGVRSALRRSIDRDSLPEGHRRDVVLLVDVTSSMAHSTTREAFEAMCTFTAGVLSTGGGERTVHLATSSSSFPPERLDGPGEIRALADRVLPTREVGWSIDLSTLDPEAALVVVSDDLPADLAQHPGVVHLLTARAPVTPSAATVTVFDPALISAVRGQDADALAAPTRIMFDTLTQGEK